MQPFTMIRPEASAVHVKGKVGASLEVSVAPGSDSQFFAGLSGDAKRGGVFVATYRPFSIGSAIALAVHLPGGVVIASGLVRFQLSETQTATAGVGIQFDGPIARGGELIDEFCRSNPPLYIDDEDEALASCA